jgi:transposase
VEGSVKRRKKKAQKMQTATDSVESWYQKKAYGGLDWASDKHTICLVNAQGKILESFEIEHSALGWKKFRERLAPYGPIPFSIETSQGAAVEQLFEAGMEVYPINAKSAKAYRERKAPSGVKDDWLDAWSFADALRVDGHGWKALNPEDPLSKELRLLCRDECSLIDQRTALICQLRHTLADYYPVALEAFEDWNSLSAWMFIQRFPTPQALLQAGKRQWEKFLHSRQLWRSESGPRRLELFAKAAEFAATEATTSAKSLLAQSLVQMLLALEKQLAEYRKRIEELFARHPDHDLFGSLPGAGKKLAPRLAAEIGTDRSRFEQASNLQCFAGTAPLTVDSGRFKSVHRRFGCNKHLRHALHLFAEKSLRQSVWAERYYNLHRSKGCSHADAIRRLAHRWLKIIHKMWLDQKTYDPELHHRNQLAHGSWIFELQPLQS